MSGGRSSLLPVSVEVDDVVYDIRYDYEAVLDILAVLNDPELDGREQSAIVLDIFYPAFENMPPDHYDEALRQCLHFINCGEDTPARRSPRLVHWEQDFPYIVAPINRVLGKEIREIPYDPKTNTGGLHWWTFLAAYQEIGDCTFAQIIRIRDHRARGKPLDKADQEWYQRNRHLVDIENKFTANEEEKYSDWLR